MRQTFIQISARQLWLVLVLLGLSLGSPPARAEEEALVDFAAEEEASELQDLALQQQTPAAPDPAPDPSVTAAKAAEAAKPEANDEEESVNFAAEEQAASASDRALQQKSQQRASDAPPNSAADDDDDEVPVDFGVEEKAAAKADQDLRGAPSEHRHGLAAGPGPGARDTDAPVGTARTALAEDPAASVDWSTQPFPEHEFSPWLVVGPGLGLLLMALHLRRR